MWRGTTSLPQGMARCLPCRRANPPQRHSAPLPSWNCIVCNVQVLGKSVKSRRGKYCKRHQHHDKGHRRRARKFGVHYEYINPRTIYERDRWMCGICKRPVDRGLQYPHPLSASLDHVVPISDGGDHAPANVQCAHHKCNHAKGNRGAGEQLALIG